MECPKCGNKLRKSKTKEGRFLCDNCRKGYLGYELEDDYEDDYKDEAPVKPKKKHRVLKMIGAVFAFIIFLGIIGSIFGEDSNDSTGDTKASSQSVNHEDSSSSDAGEITAEEQEQDANVDFDSTLKSQKNALDSLIKKYESGEESAGTSSERLSGLADGIQNTINMMNGVDGTDELVQYAAALKGVASHYSEYIKTGNQSELDDANKLMETIE